MTHIMSPMSYSDTCAITCAKLSPSRAWPSSVPTIKVQDKARDSASSSQPVYLGFGRHDGFDTIN